MTYHRFPYADLWGEKQIRSIANLTRQDGKEFMSIVDEGFIRPKITTYPLHWKLTGLLRIFATVQLTAPRF